MLQSARGLGCTRLLIQHSARSGCAETLRLQQALHLRPHPRQLRLPRLRRRLQAAAGGQPERPAALRLFRHSSVNTLPRRPSSCMTFSVAA